MENPKRHKRSGSSGLKSGYGPSYQKKKVYLPKIHGKFQVGQPKVERKNIDVDLNATVATLPSLVTATPVLLNTYAAGTGPTGTIGRKATNLSVHVRMTITAGGGTTFSGIRVLVVYDRQPNGAALSAATLLGATTYGSASLLNLAYSDRFSVILDEYRTLYPGSTATSADSQIQVINRYCKCKLPSEAVSSFSGGIGQIASGAIWMLAWSDVAAASNPPSVLVGASRIRFIDA